MFFHYVLFSAFFYVIGDIFGKIWAVKNDPKYFWIGLFLYSIGGIFALYTVKESSLSLALLVLPPVTILIGFFTGHVFFGEKLSMAQYLGGFIIFLGLILLLWNPKISI